MKFSINITWSKLMALIILLIGAGYSYLTQTAGVITLTIPISAGIIGWKQQKDKEKAIR